tara:strand:+ start:361 stop:645 length:285 start_codon:yes stop_codon:yes gene_type:complete
MSNSDYKKSIRFVRWQKPVDCLLIEPWKTQIAELTKLDNICCKLSGLITEADVDRWTKEEIRTYMENVPEVFGFERVMFGSDWLVCELGIEYRQ